MRVTDSISLTWISPNHLVKNLLFGYSVSSSSQFNSIQFNSQTLLRDFTDTLIEQHSKSQKNSRNEGLNNVEGIAIPTKIDTRTKRAVLGYSSIQELVFQIAEKQRKRFNSDDYLCMCGLPLGVWQPLGLFDERVAHRKDLSSFVCEACFRQMTTKLSTASMVIGDTGRCVVPNTPSRRPESFLSIYYGSSAALNKFRGTTGQLVGLHLLSSEKLLSQVSEQNSFLRSEKKGMVSF